MRFLFLTQVFKLHLETQFIPRTYLKVAIHIFIIRILRHSFKTYCVKYSFSCEITDYFVLPLELDRLPLLADFRPRLSRNYQCSRLVKYSSYIGRELCASKLSVKVMWLELVFVLLYEVDTKFSHKSHRDVHQKSIIKPVYQLAR